jgi:hypothetical protein
MMADQDTEIELNGKRFQCKTRDLVSYLFALLWLGIYYQQIIRHSSLHIHPPLCMHELEQQSLL